MFRFAAAAARSMRMRSIIRPASPPQNRKMQQRSAARASAPLIEWKRHPRVVFLLLARSSGRRENRNAVSADARPSALRVARVCRSHRTGMVCSRVRRARFASSPTVSLNRNGVRALVSAQHARMQLKVGGRSLTLRFLGEVRLERALANHAVHVTL